MNAKIPAGATLIGAGPNDGTIDFPMEHMPLVANSLICELLYSFERELVKTDKGMEYVWKGEGVDGEPVDALFDFFGQDVLAVSMLTQFCDANGLGFNLVHTPPQLKKAPYQCFLLGIDEAGGPVQKAVTQGNRVAPVICLLVLATLKADMRAQHRLLFPGHYIVLAS